jgi:putative intracellular protease/amidase
MKKILIPLPNRDFDLTEVSVPWKLFKQKGYEVVFSTEKGTRAYCDPKLITGVIFGQLGATKEAISFYREMEKSPEFLHPIKYDEINPADYDLLHLPGGHATGMRQYLESTVLQQKVLQFFRLNKPVGSICHGAIVLARTIDPETKKSVVYNYKLTGLIKSLERLAYYVTFWKLGKYYRTYPAYVEDEVKSVLIDPINFLQGHGQNVPYVCVDRNLITARWPKDAFVYAEKLIEVLEKK